MFIFRKGPLQDLKRALTPDLGFNIRPKKKPKLIRTKSENTIRPANTGIPNSNYISYLSQIRAYTDSGDYESGIKMALEAINKFPLKKYEFNYWLGLNHYCYSTVFYTQNRFSRAQIELKKADKAFRKALKSSNPDQYTENHFYLGVINERRGNQKKAIKHYNRALAKERDFTPALERLKKIDMKKKRSDSNSDKEVPEQIDMKKKANESDTKKTGGFFPGVFVSAIITWLIFSINNPKYLEEQYAVSMAGIFLGSFCSALLGGAFGSIKKGTAGGIFGAVFASLIIIYLKKLL